MNRDLMHSSDELLRLTTEMVGIAVWEYDFTAGQMLRSDNHDSLYGLPWQDFWDINTFLNATHPDDREKGEKIIQASVAPGGSDDYAFDFRVQWPDNDTHWLWARGRVVKRDETGQGVLVRGVLVDITERIINEEKIKRLTKLYAALSQCNQAIVRCKNETDLFAQICKDAITFGGMKMAWIGMVDAADNRIKPVSSFGSGTEYLEEIEISLDVSNPFSHGPTGTSVRENRPVWCQDFQNDPSTIIRKSLAGKFGWGASAALPLHRNGATVGAIVFYAEEPFSFDEPAQKLLTEMATDISFALDHFALQAERENALDELEKSERHLRTMIETEPECVKVIGTNGELLHMNAAGLALLELDSLEEAKAHNLLEFVIPEYRESFMTLHSRVLEGESAFLEFEILGIKGKRRWVETHAAPLSTGKDGIVHLLGITRDVTERKRSEERIRYLANFDALTGLPNRTQLDSHLNFALSLAKRTNGMFAVMFLDLDKFKDINDSLGHRIGDALLVEVSHRLREALREEDTVSRLGGDEFILMFPGCDVLGAAHVARKLLDSINSPYRIEQYDLTVSASIGITLYPNDGDDLDSLFKNADTAMYRAKKYGRNRYSFFTSEMQVQVARNMQLLNALRVAQERNEFRLSYQPQMDISGQRIIGVEALLRWKHPDIGAIHPTEFIPVAEDSGLIISIGEWVLRTAVMQLKQWMNEGLSPFIVSVNLSAVQFRHPGLSELLAQILREANLPPELLELELTESVVMNDLEAELAILRSLHELGIRMSIDDFGTGYSSLSYLKKFKVYKLKIDQSFVRDIGTDVEDRAIVAAIISMAKSLGLKTIAEGVETPEQLLFLKQQGCDEVQGYLYSKPVAPEEIVKFHRLFH